MSTICSLLPYAAAVLPASADAADVRLTAGAATVCVVDSADGLP